MKRKAIEYNAPLNDSEDENDNDNDNNDHISVQHKKFIRLNEPNDNNAISNTFVPSNSKNFEAAVIKRLKEIINSNDRNNKKSIRDHIYKGIQNQILLLSLSFSDTYIFSMYRAQGSIR